MGLFRGGCCGSLPCLVSVLCPGLHAMLSATAGRSDDPALLATDDLRIYREVSLYREFLCASCACSWVVWVTSMQAAITGPRTARGTTAPGVMSLACCMAARVCWCSRGTRWCARRCWDSHSAPCIGSSEEQRLQVPDQPGRAVVPGFCGVSAEGCWLQKRG